MSERLFGASVRRREDGRLVTGRGRYVADVALPGALHVAIHRSPHAHARIAGVDATDTRRQPGEYRVRATLEGIGDGARLDVVSNRFMLTRDGS